MFSFTTNGKREEKNGVMNHNSLRGNSDQSGAINSRSLISGGLDLSEQDLLMGVDDNSDISFAPSSESLKEQGEGQNLEFDLHLPDFDKLMIPRGSGVGRNSGTNHMAHISVGTPSVKSQFYLSSASHIGSEVEGFEDAVNERDFGEKESLFSGDSFFSASNEINEEDLEQLNNTYSTNDINISGNNSNRNADTMPTQLALTNNDNIGNELHSVTNNIVASSNIRSTTTLSSAASLYLNSANEEPNETNTNNNRALLFLSEQPQRTPTHTPKTKGMGRTTQVSSPTRLYRIQNVTEIDFLKDNHKDMTYSRRIALYLSGKYQWYNPKLNKNSESNDVEQGLVEVRREAEAELSYNDLIDNNKEASIEAAWAYYEHMTLPRYLVDDDDDDKDEDEDEDKKRDQSFIKRTFESFRDSFQGNTDRFQLPIAVPGTKIKESRLYSPWTTHISQMGDFGLGVGLYFGTLRAFTVLLILAGILNIPNILFFASSDYSNRQKDVIWYLKGSAVCNVHEWVPCSNCTLATSPFSPFEKTYRLQTLTNSKGQEMTFVLRNLCDGAKFQVGMINFGTILLVILGMFLMAGYLDKKREQFDLDEQTAQDYSISIHNPPKDAFDPEEWKDYFKNNFPDCDCMHVTSCTVAIDNDRLINCLSRRRQLIENLKYILPDMDMVEDEVKLKEISEERIEKCNVFQKFLANQFGVPAMYEKMVKLNKDIKEMVKEDYSVTNVFVMFETEKAQRHVLEKLTVSKYHVKKNDPNALSNPSYLFRGNLVLDIQEAEEPSTIRWKELNLTKKDLLIKIVMTSVVFGMIALCAFIVYLCNRRSENLAAATIAIFNISFPVIAKMITSFERHSREEHRQVWMYFKIAFFRWVNTAVITTIIMPFTSTTLPNDVGLLNLVYKIFFAEIITSTLIQFFDPVENFFKHFVAPRATTQEKMNLYFCGTEIFLAERYTNLTKIVFLSLWYCPIYPAVLFLAAIALGVNYFIDRFSIMRTWKPQPKLGVSIANYTRVYVFPVTVLVMSYVAFWYWGSFKFDYVCAHNTAESETNLRDYYNTPWLLNTTDVIDSNTYVMISNNTVDYQFCSRKTWTTGDQTRLTNVYQRFFFVNVSIVLLILSIAVIVFMRNYFFTKHETIGDDQNIPMRDVSSMSAYIPQVKNKSIPYPLIACDVEQISTSNLFEWFDPLRPYGYYDLTKDVKRLLRDDEDYDRSKVVFSRMVHWPFDS